MFAIVEDPKNISDHDFDLIKKTGMAYVKLPEAILSNLKKIREIALDFFNKEEDYKRQFPFDKKNGYINHADLKKYNAQRYIYRDTIFAPDFQPIETIIKETREFFRSEISEKILYSIFKKLNAENMLSSLLTNPDYTISIIYYPPADLDNNRLGAHKDIPLINVLWAPQAGLEAKVGDKWFTVEPKEDYLTIQLGRALERITDGAYHATEHRVAIDKDIERLSLASFLGPADETTLTNLVTRETITERYSDFVQELLEEFYTKK